MDNLEIGRRGEQAAAAYLAKAGYLILAANYRAKGGEIDIIAHCPQKEYLVFFEVKTRSAARQLNYGVPAAAVTWKKQRKIIKTALCYLAHSKLNPDDTACRFDVLEILVKSGGFEYNHIINAFGES